MHRFNRIANLKKCHDFQAEIFSFGENARNYLEWRLASGGDACRVLQSASVHVVPGVLTPLL